VHTQVYSVLATDFSRLELQDGVPKSRRIPPRCNGGQNEGFALVHLALTPAYLVLRANFNFAEFRSDFHGLKAVESLPATDGAALVAVETSRVEFAKLCSRGSDRKSPLVLTAQHSEHARSQNRDFLHTTSDI